MKIFYLPDLGEGLAEAEIREWYVKEGDEVSLDQPLVSMETAKAVVDVPSPYSGKISKLHGKPNDIIKTGAALIDFETDDVTHEKAKNTVVGALEEGKEKWQEDEIIVGRSQRNTTQLKIMPAARVLATHLDIDLTTVTPSGPQSLITVDDVKSKMAHAASSTSFNLGEGAEPLHGVRRAMALAMMQSHREIVPVTVFDDADITESTADITVQLIKALVAAAAVEPALNAWFDGKKLQRQLIKEVNVGLAVDTSEGLFVPVIKDAGAKSAADLRQAVNDYKKAVKERSVSQAAMQHATITLSNFGMIAGRYATPIIVPPTVAILGCGQSRESVLVKNGKTTVARLLPLSLTFDHRAVTGGEATRFLATVIRFLKENGRK